MPEPTPSPTPPAKWWAASKTIWGALVTALATVLPALGPVLGFNLPPELILQFGDQLLLVVQAVGGLAGTILTIYGRLRATTALERRRVTLSL